jgi:hypothetical protein
MFSGLRRSAAGEALGVRTGPNRPGYWSSRGGEGLGSTGGAPADGSEFTLTELTRARGRDTLKASSLSGDPRLLTGFRNRPITRMREVKRIGGAAMAYPETPKVSEHFLLEENPLSAA